LRRLWLLLLLFLIVGCGKQTTLAPVVELKWHSQNTRQATHVVRRGETLYAIAFRYDKDYRQLATYNHLRSPYALRVGQVIRLQYLSRRNKAYYAPVKTAKNTQPIRRPVRRVAPHASPRPRTQVATGNSVHWIWPAKGRVASNFFPAQGKKGIDIAGKKGDSVYAAAGGVVAYSGSGLSGYGNLIIIKHEGQFLTAYGNNLRNRVTEGQKVKAGQIIAEMGIVGRKFWGVHFEIRKAGQPVNPMSYLQRGR
jgi:lipoprotein NlpD